MLNVETQVEAPEAIQVLVERFDADVIDVPGGSARIRLESGGDAWDVLIAGGSAELQAAEQRLAADCLLTAKPDTWRDIASDIRGGMMAFRRGGLHVRRNLHLGIGFLAATSGMTEPGRLRFDSVRTKKATVSTLSAGTGEPVVCIHGLGGTKASFLPTVAALADRHRVIALDLPGFGESDKPIAAAYDAPYFANSVTALMDELGLESAHIIGNSLGGRVGIELGLLHSERVRKLALLSPAVAWLRDRPLKRLLQLPLPRLGLIQPTPRFIAEPNGDDGFWTRLGGLECDTLFVWGRSDTLVPIAFMKHVERTLPRARHVELDCGHVPQLERPIQTHAAIRELLATD